MKLNTLATLTLLLAALWANAQPNKLQTTPGLVLPKDSVETQLLLTTLNDFLTLAQSPNEQNTLVLETEKVETYILLDEINGIEKSGRYKNDNFYTPYLTNVVPINKTQYYMQVSYMGIKDSSAILRASFELIAHKINDTFFYSSPLIKNTKSWKVYRKGNAVFHYKDSINKAKTEEYIKYITAFDGKLKSTIKLTEIYCCNNITELQKLIGIQYKSDYNGRTESVFSAMGDDKIISVLGNSNDNFSDFDPHDLWHSRLSLVIARSKVNKPVDEGCAYLYGGSWGLSWQEIFDEFKTQVAGDKNTNWADIKETPVYFKTNGYSNAADYIVNALLVKKIEKENGFAGVWELLNVGPFEKGNAEYYKTLEKLTGITKQNYNEKIWDLINNAK
jgi:hypothetical protein